MAKVAAVALKDSSNLILVKTVLQLVNTVKEQTNSTVHLLMEERKERESSDGRMVQDTWVCSKMTKQLGEVT